MSVSRFLIFSLIGWGPVAIHARGQVVQLPTFRQFSVGTTVSVPDRGAAPAAGISRARASGVVHGVPVASRVPGFPPIFRRRASASQFGHGHATVRATIIDLQQAEAALGDRGPPATATRVERHDPVHEKARFLSRHVGRAADHPQRPAWAADVSAASRSVAGRTAFPEPAHRPPRPRR